MIAAPPSQHVSAGALALLVHGLLLLALIFGLSWTSLPHLPVQADLWSALPKQPPPPPPVAMEPATPPDPAPTPKLEAAPAPMPAPAEIALEQEKLRERELRLREERERRAALEESLKRQAEETRARVEAAREERVREEQRARLERERADAELRDLRQRQIAEEIARMREEMEAEAARERDAQARVHAARQARVVEDFKLRIKEKILAYLRLPPNLKGNPEVEYRVDLLPNGEVLRVTLRTSSGQPAYDAEVERAILRSSPLPLPPDRDTARVFREGLILKFRPSENAGG